MRNLKTTLVRATALTVTLTVAGMSPSLASTQRIGPIGSVTATGGNSIEADGAEGSPLTAVHPWADGYMSVGTSEGSANEPGICMSGDHSRSYYEQPGYGTGQDCNEQLLDEDSLGSIGD